MHPCRPDEAIDGGNGAVQSNFPAIASNSLIELLLASQQ